MNWLIDLIFFAIWIILGILMIYGAYYERNWLNLLFKFPSLGWLRQRYGVQNVRTSTIIFGIIWIIFGLRFTLDRFLAINVGKIILIIIVIGIFLAIYFKGKQSDKSE